MATLEQRVTSLEAKVKAQGTRLTTAETKIKNLATDAALSRTLIDELAARLDDVVSPPPVEPPSVEPPPVDPPPTPPVDGIGIPAGTVLHPSSTVTVTVAGTVLEDLDVTGSIDVRAKNVTIRRCRVTGGGAVTVLIREGASAMIEDSEIIGGENGVGFGNYVLRRSIIRGQYGDGLKLGSNCLVEYCMIHDLKPAQGAHADGAQVQFGVTNLIVRFCTFDVTGGIGNAALFIAPDQGPSTDGPILIEGNLLAGGNYTLYCVDGGNGQYVVGNITIKDNIIAAGQYGTHNVNVPVRWVGNTTPAGAPIPL